MFLVPDGRRMPRCVERGGGLPEGRRKSGGGCDDESDEMKVNYRTVEAANWLAAYYYWLAGVCGR